MSALEKEASGLPFLGRAQTVGWWLPVASRGSSSSTKGRAMFVCLPSGAQPESCTPSRRNSNHWARKWSFRPLPRNTPSLSLGNFTEEIAMITKPIAPN